VFLGLFKGRKQHRVAHSAPLQCIHYFNDGKIDNDFDKEAKRVQTMVLSIILAGGHKLSVISVR